MIWIGYNDAVITASAQLDNGLTHAHAWEFLKSQKNWKKIVSH